MEIEKLLSPYIDRDFKIPEFPKEKLNGFPAIPQDHMTLLKGINGFYAFNRGLHLFGICEKPNWHDIRFWNAKDSWRKDYGKLVRDIYFFAEDYFGGQYGYRKKQIVHLEPETGYVQDVAVDLKSWLEMIVSDPDVNLMLILLRKWQAAGNQLEFGKHLFPVTPFVLGGSDDIDSIKAVSSLDNMRFKAHLASQISKYPDGTQVEIKFLPPQ